MCVCVYCRMKVDARSKELVSPQNLAQVDTCIHTCMHACVHTYECIHTIADDHRER